MRHCNRCCCLAPRGHADVSVRIVELLLSPAMGRSGLTSRTVKVQRREVAGCQGTIVSHLLAAWEAWPDKLRDFSCKTCAIVHVMHEFHEFLGAHGRTAC